MAKQPEQKTFKISQLEEIQNLDEKDLFLISDYEGGKCYTKKLTMGKLLTVLAQNPDFIEKLLEDETVEQTISDKVDEALNIVEIDGGNAFRKDG